MTSRWARFWYWGGLVARVVVGGIWIVAGWLKLPDPAEGVRAVRAYKILPESVVPIVGHGLPALELVVGLLLVLGLGTRIVAVMSALLQLAFIIGISSAWARGLQIECGCFGGGGTTENASAAYPWDIARDVGLFALSVLIATFPRTAWRLDAVLGLDKEYDA